MSHFYKIVMLQKAEVKLVRTSWLSFYGLVSARNKLQFESNTINLNTNQSTCKVPVTVICIRSVDNKFWVIVMWFSFLVL